MSHTYDGVPAPLPTLTLPDDNDDIDAASVNIVFEPLADAQACLFLPTQTMTTTWQYLAGEWDTSGDDGHAEQVTSGATMAAVLDLTHARTVSEVKVYVRGPAHGDFPGDQPTMPKVRLYRIEISATTPASSVSAEITDSSATDEDYEAQHSIDITGLAVVVDRILNRYMVRITGEAGANFQPNLQVWGVEVTYSS